ncbi:MAG: right-handed parallel beta-helix repeat-containing protein, partial [Elusimicrobia bacterium]|nr:right-handed parallel beta-helix repeat-containing protein [Elusimicrobiota bacterium]
DPGGEISKAGISISSQSTISYSSVTVGAVYGFWLPGSTMTTVSYSSAQANGGSGALYLNGASNNTVTVFLSSNTAGDTALLDAGASFNTITLSTFTSPSFGSFYGFYLKGASSNTISRCYFDGPNGYGKQTILLSAGSNANTISLSTAVNSGTYGNVVYFNGASSNTLTQSFFASDGVNGNALNFGNSANGNVIKQSTMTCASAGDALYLNGASSNTITQSYGASAAAMGLYLLNQADYNTISLSTFTGYSGAFGGAVTINASYNTVTQSLFLGVTSAGAGYILGSGNDNSVSLSTFTGGSSGLVIEGSSNTVSGSAMAGGIGLYLYSGYSNAVSLSTMTGVGGGSDGLAVLSTSSNTVSQCFMSGVYGAYINTAGSGSTISLSTMTGSSYGLWFAGNSSSYTIVGSYMQGGLEGVRVNSTGTAIGGSIVASLGSGDSAIFVSAASVNLTISSTTILRGPGGSGNAGIYFQANTSGLINLSSNTINPGYQYGIYMATQAPNAAIWITSNTIVPTVTGVTDSYGLYFAGLPSGATVQNNAFVWRDAGSQSGHTAYGLYAHSVAGLNFDHNRINMPGLLTAGSFIGAYFTGAQQTSFKFNDVSSTGTSFTNAYLLQLAVSTVAVRDNVFLASMTVSGSSASLSLDAVSGLGGADGSDYNDWYSSNSLNTFLWGAGAAQFSNGWFGQDAYSIAADPLWHDVSAGIEDFHPQSKIGRYDPASGTFVKDGAQSPTIDAGDPKEDYSLEPAPNSGQANQGSYGDTAQASESVLVPGCSLEYKVNQTKGPYTSIQGAVDAIANPMTGYACVIIEDGATYAEQVTVEGFTNNGSSITIEADPASGLTPVVSPPATSTAAFQIAQSSVNILGINIVPTNAMTYGIQASSSNITISSVNVQDAGGKITQTDIALSSSNALVSYSSVTAGSEDAAQISGPLNTISFSTFVALGTSIYVTGSSSTFADDYVYGVNGLILSSDYNTVKFSTCATRTYGYVAGLYFQGSHNTVTNSYMLNPGGGQGIYALYNGPRFNTISSSTIQSLYLNGNAGNVPGNYTFDRDFFTNGTNFECANCTISNSTFTTTLKITIASSITVVNSYVYASTAVVINKSTGTTINSTVLNGSQAATGSGLYLDNSGNVNLSLSLDTITGGAQGYGVYLDAGNSGLINLSTNTINPGAEYGIYVATPAAGAQIWITSNTIIPTVTSANPTYGIMTDGLTSGATIQNNLIVVRQSGSMGSATMRSMLLLNSSGLNIDHNRITLPGLLTGGNFTAVKFNGTTATSFKFNDVYSTGSNFHNAYLLNLVASTVTIRDNIFFSSFVVTGSSASLDVDDVSGFGGADGSDYNDWYSSTGLNNFVWGQSSAQFSSGWLGQDSHSIAGNPLWHDPSSGVEDFHPQSKIGRYDPGTGTFAKDGAQSPAIDAGDPAEDYSLEPSPNGSLVNQGSYGDTAQASESTRPNCPTAKTVCASGCDATKIQDAINLLPNPLTGYSCIEIQDNGTYDEQVTVEGFTNNGSSITIEADPASGLTPVVSPPATSTAAFQIAQSSVNILGINIVPTNAMTYGIQASSSNITISSVDVQDAGGKITMAGIAISSQGAVSYSSVTVHFAHGLWVSAPYGTVSYSTFTNNSGVSFYPVYLNGASSTTITAISAISLGNSGHAINLDGGASYNTIAQSTFTASGAANGVYSLGASWNTYTSDYFDSAGGGYGLGLPGNGHNTVSQSTATSMSFNSSYNTITGSFFISQTNTAVTVFGAYNTISQSTFTSNSSSGYGLNLSAANNTITDCYLSGNTGTALYFNANNNVVTQSTMTSRSTTQGTVYFSGASSNALTHSTVLNPAGGYGAHFVSSKFNSVAGDTVTAGSYGLYFYRSSSNTIVDSYIQGSTAAYVSGSTGTTIGGSVLVATNTAGMGLELDHGSVNLTLSSSTLTGGFLGAGVYLDAGNSGLINLSTNTIDAGAQYALYVGAQAGNAQVWITSNTILPTAAGPTNVPTYGVYLDGLTSGATIENNAIDYRVPGSPYSAYALYAQNASGLNIDHNRISDPGIVTGGAFTAAYFYGTQATSFKFNDVYSTGTSLGNGILVQLGASTVTIRDNIFFSSFVVTGSSASLDLDAVSGLGGANGSDYNDWYSSTSLNSFIWGQSSAQFSKGWFGQDAHSIAGNPLWNDTASGAEDFHPQSTAGRYDPATQTFVKDGADSPTLDAADPAESYSLEPLPNGGRANQGSYGDTDEASKAVSKFNGEFFPFD